MNNTPKWFLVACSGGVDLCQKSFGKDEVLIDCLDYELARKIMEEHNNYAALKKSHARLLKIVQRECDLEGSVSESEMKKAISAAESLEVK